MEQYIIFFVYFESSTVNSGKDNQFSGVEVDTKFNLRPKILDRLSSEYMQRFCSVDHILRAIHTVTCTLSFHLEWIESNVAGGNI